MNKPELSTVEYIIADMHTHSEFSHDSVCKAEDMLKAEISRGTKIFAVTDHADIASHTDSDIFTPIKKSYLAAAELNERYRGECEVLSGVEISEGFWYPETCQQMISLCDYDVIIGSVHIVRCGCIEKAYSVTDFSCIPRETVLEFLEKYFDDIITMLDTVDFDILAHLTCPLRYLNGKYKLDIDISPYRKKIEAILKAVIARDIALEINSSSYDVLGDFFPSEDIVRTYYQLGGRRITLASDAHVANNASVNLDKAVEMLRRVGFGEIYYYRKRVPYPLKIQ